VEKDDLSPNLPPGRDRLSPKVGGAFKRSAKSPSLLGEGDLEGEAKIRKEKTK